MTSARKLSTISIQGIDKVHNISVRQSVKKMYYLESLLSIPDDKYYKFQKLLDSCNDVDRDFLKLSMFYTMYNSGFSKSFPVSDKISVEVQKNALTIKAVSNDALNKVLLNTDKVVNEHSISLKELCSIIQMSYEPVDIDSYFKKLKKAYSVDDIIEDFRIVLMITKNDRYMISFYHKDFDGEVVVEGITMMPNPLGDIPEAIFELITIDI